MGGRKAVVFAVNNPFTAALNPNHGTPNSAGISARVVRFMRTRGGHDPTQGRRPESEKTEIDSESCGVTVIYRRPHTPIHITRDIIYIACLASPLV